MAEPPGRRYCTHDALPHGPKTLHENSRNDAPEPPARRPSARRQLCGGVARARNLRADMHVLRGRVPRRTGSPRAASPLHPRQPRLRRRLHCRRSDSDAANGNARRTRPRAVARLYCRLPHVQRGVQAARRNARSLPHLRRNLPALSAAVQFSAGCNELGRDRREREPALSAPRTAAVPPTAASPGRAQRFADTSAPACGLSIRLQTARGVPRHGAAKNPSNRKKFSDPFSTTCAATRRRPLSTGCVQSRELMRAAFSEPKRAPETPAWADIFRPSELRNSALSEKSRCGA